MLERWRERDVFGRSLAAREGAEVWSFYEGPPTANGRPGSHHVLSRVFKDVYPRYRTMRGYRVPRKAGWDCHGLPVELEVEKQLGISSKQEIEEYGIAEFKPACRDSVFEYVEEWNRLTERIGFWIDLDDPYVTLEDDYIESVWWSLRQLWDKGRLYEGHKVVPYCPRDGTAALLARGRAGLQGRRGPLDLRPLPAARRARGASGESLLVWTTTPWTLPGNVAVAVAPDVTYVKAPPRRRDPDPRRGAGREGPRRGGRARRADRRRRPGRAPTTRARSSTSPTASAAASRSSPATSSPPRTAPGWSTSRRPSARTTTRSPPPTGSSTRPGARRSTTRSTPTAPSTPGSPASRAGSSRTPS